MGHVSPRTIFWIDGTVANSFWFELMKRNLRCHPLIAPVTRILRKIRVEQDWLLLSPAYTSGSVDTKGVIAKSGLTLPFTPAENRRAHFWLKKVGWHEGQPIVCFLVRDSAYLDSEPGLRPSDKGLSEGAWDYHSYRDSRIETYVAAMEWLANEGALVLRMGKTMADAVSCSHPGIIDYAFRDDKDDFLDVWLFANCTLCVTTGTGPDMISVVYGRHVLALNYIPISGIVTSGPVTTAGKRLYSNRGRRLSLEENFRISHFSSESFEREGIIIRDLGSSEILEIVKEKWEEISGRACYDEAEKAKARAILSACLNQSPLADVNQFLHPHANLSRAWLRRLEAETA